MLLSWGASFRIFFQLQNGRVSSDKVIQGIEPFLSDCAIGQYHILGPMLHLFDQLLSFFQPEHVFFKIDGSCQLVLFKYRMGRVECIVFLAVHGFVAAQPVPDFFAFPDAGKSATFF